MGKFDYSNNSFRSRFKNDVTAVVTVIGICVTLSLGLVSTISHWADVKVAELKERPLACIWYRDFFDSTIIYMENKGIGPMIVSDYYLENLKSNERQEGIFYCLSEYKKYIDYHTGNQVNSVISAGQKVLLFKLEKKFLADSIVEKIRTELSKYKVVIKYQDVYGNTLPIYQRSLDWFGRNIKK
jgi:hypothetical protein